MKLKLKRKSAPGVGLEEIEESGNYWAIVAPKKNYKHNIPEIISIWITIKPHAEEYIVKVAHGRTLSEDQFDELRIWPEKIASPPESFITQTT